MALPKGAHVRNAHYHPIKATRTWAKMVAAMQAERTRSPGQDERTDDERERETTYARDELGYS